MLISRPASLKRNKRGELEDRRQCTEREDPTVRRSLALRVAGR